MRIYWSDREGNPPPPDCAFSWQPFGKPIQTGPVIFQNSLPPPVFYKVLKRTYLPTQTEWNNKVQNILARIEQNELQKVVLARICTLELDTIPDPFAITAALKQKAQGSFVFCLQSENFSFLGATPERLFARKGEQIHSEALAGTRPLDPKWTEELLTDPKEQREFHFVQSYLQTTLGPLCNHLKFAPTSVHKTSHLQHLYSPCSGELKQGTTDAQIIKQLHPTPALCGTPKEKAFHLIHELEPFERGLYTGVMGWHTPTQSEWIVGIRSCLIKGNTVTLFSGTGIVEGSDPQREWEELNQKLKLYDEIFLS